MSILLGNVQTANTSLMFISTDLAPDKQCLLVQVGILVNNITLHCSTTYVDVPYCHRRSSVVCLSVRHDHELCKMAEPIEIPFCLRTQASTRKHVLDRGAHWRNMANRLNRQCAAMMRPFCQITLTTFYKCRYTSTV